jgi:hypothetical protein
MFLGFSGVFPLSSCSLVLVSSLYTSCMLRGAFYAFYKILYLLIKKNVCSDIILNCHLSQKLKLIRKFEFNYLINILT